ncbi:hypothetical protein, partial [Aequorivita antarctica]|uniref:hypothetical protein n=1 Tax=Aequorivita antarctica TaxID=153266 RepID=UPI001B86A623
CSMAFFKSSKFGTFSSLIKKTKPLKAAYMGWVFINYGVVQRLPMLATGFIYHRNEIYIEL